MIDLRRFTSGRLRADRAAWLRSRPLRGRMPLAVLVGGAVVAVTAAVSGAAVAPPELRFAQAGHWVANPALGMVFHVNGAARTVDAQAAVPGIQSGDQVVQGDTSGFVVGRSRIVEFGKSSLKVEQTRTAPTGERPVAVEIAGGPYLVYREAGTVVRLGDGAASIRVGGALGDPVSTPDGTLWLHRLGTNELCQLPPGADRASCPVTVPTGHAGALSVVGDRPVFVDTEDDTVRPVTADGLGFPTPIDVDLPPTARVAPSDVDGRVAILDPGARRMHLVDADPGGDRRAGPSIAVALPDGTYAAPSVSGSSVVLLDLAHHTVLTYGSNGQRQQASVVPREAGEPRLSRGEDRRVYVDGAEGRHVLVVDHGGEVRPVSVVRPDQSPDPRAPQAPPTGPQAPPTGPRPTPANPAAPAVGTTAARPDPQERRPRPDAQSRGTPTQTQTQTQAPAPPPPKVDAPPAPPPAASAVPASPPGMPPNLRAAPGDGNLAVTWGAAAANGAAVSVYHVTWARVSGGGDGSATRPGTARSMTVTGLTRGVAYRITVVAQNSAGRGAPATTQATVPAPTPTVTVSRGGPATVLPTCVAPNCAYMRVQMRGFAPNTAYKLTPDSTGNYHNGGATLTTDARGGLVTERFAFGQVGELVWVTVVPVGGGDAVVSNRYVWRAG